MTLGEAITATREEGGFDEPDTRLRGWLLSRLKAMVARARWRRMEVSVGPTVAGQSRYAIDANVVDLWGLKAGGARLDLISPDDLADLQEGRASRSSGAFAPAFDSSGGEFLDLWPVPAEAGVVLTALVAWEPAALADTAELPIPVEMHDHVVDGAIATGLRRVDERLQEADVFEARFEQGVQMLTARRNSRVGSGPVRIRTP